MTAYHQQRKGKYKAPKPKSQKVQGQDVQTDPSPAQWLNGKTGGKKGKGKGKGKDQGVTKKPEAAAAPVASLQDPTGNGPPSALCADGDD